MNMLILLLIFSMQTSFIVYGDISNETEETLVSSEEIKVIPEILPIMFLVPRKNDSFCSSVDDFPNFFTEAQRRNGAIIIPFIVGMYCFTLLAIVCDKYFLPCVEKICDFLNLSQDVAAATFMAMATSAPELFVNVIGTFLTESDMGIGTVVGSSMFNTLGVAALGGLAARAPIKVDWWPVTRDCFLYLISISLLVVMSWDAKVYWYEGMILFIVYFIYFTIMFNNSRISRIVKGAVKKLKMKSNSSTIDLINSKVSLTSGSLRNVSLSTPPIYLVEEHMKNFDSFPSITDVENSDGKCNDEPLKLYTEFTMLDKVQMEERIRKESFNVYIEINPTKTEQDTGSKSDTSKPSCAKSAFNKFMYFYTWPIKALLYCIIPDSSKRPKLFPITFILCILVIGANSYIISWMITIIGHTFRIADSILGLTFLAGGGCLPEAISIIIMSRKGQGSMGISNALGANTMNILLSLGMPWFIKTMIVENRSGKFIEIASGAIEYTILSLVLVVCSLFITLYFNEFKLQKRTGIILVVIYLVFLGCTITSEMLLLEPQPCD